jgi:hypothetical protein
MTDQDEPMRCPKCWKSDFKTENWETCEGGLIFPPPHDGRESPRFRRTVINECQNCNWRQVLTYNHGTLVKLENDLYG